MSLLVFGWWVQFNLSQMVGRSEVACPDEWKGFICNEGHKLFSLLFDLISVDLMIYRTV